MTVTRAASWSRRWRTGARSHTSKRPYVPSRRTILRTCPSWLEPWSLFVHGRSLKRCHVTRLGRSSQKNGPNTHQVAQEQLHNIQRRQLRRTGGRDRCSGCAGQQRPQRARPPTHPRSPTDSHPVHRQHALTTQHQVISSRRVVSPPNRRPAAPHASAWACSQPQDAHPPHHTATFSELSRPLSVPATASTLIRMNLENATWRKASWSGENGGDCVEVAGPAGVVAVRDSKDPDGPVLLVTRAALRTAIRCAADMN